MFMKQLSRWRQLGPSIAMLGLSVAISAPLAAQPLIPIGPLVGLDQECTDSPTVLATEGELVAVWRRTAKGAGLFVRTGPTLEHLGPKVELRDHGPIDEVRVVAVPGGFVAAWIRFTPAQIAEAVFQRFGLDLLPDGAEVVVGQAWLGGAPALLADENGLLTIAYYGPARTVQARRYTDTGVPLTPPIDVDPLVPMNSVGLTRLAAGDDGFLVAWEGSLPAQASGMWVRAFGFDGAPAAASVRVVTLGSADFDVAWAEDEYLAAVLDGNVWGYRLDASGTPTAPAGLLAPANGPSYVRLAAGSDVLWLSFVEYERGLFASRIELPSLAVLEDPQLLGPQPGTDFVSKGSVLPTATGLIATWQTAWFSPIPLPCSGEMAIFAQEFGNPPTVDVPTLPPSGLLALALLVAAGGLLLLRR